MTNILLKTFCFFKGHFCILLYILPTYGLYMNTAQLIFIDFNTTQRDNEIYT